MDHQVKASCLRYNSINEDPEFQASKTHIPLVVSIRRSRFVKCLGPEVRGLRRKDKQLNGWYVGRQQAGGSEREPRVCLGCA